MPSNNPNYQKEYIKKHYQANKEYYKEKAKRNKEVSRTTARKFTNRVKLKFGCSHCSYNKHPEALQFHHLQDKKYNVSEMVSRGHGLSKIKTEIRKCIILCANCHAIETSELRKP